MGFAIDGTAVARLSAMPAVREAARAGAALIALWPLTDAERLDNDAKYAENLQVRLTRTLARILTHDDVTVPDAEFVYEGADEIPGRPQHVVDALLAANDAYDLLLTYGETGDASLVREAAELLGADWSASAAARVDEVLSVVDVAESDGMSDDADNAMASDADTSDADTASDGAMAAIARRFAVALTVCDALFDAVAPSDASDNVTDDADGDDDDRALAVLPVLLAMNELRERIGVPRIALEDTDVAALLEAREHARRTGSPTADAVAALIAPLAAREWKRHREDVLWDPEAAKKQAKEEDERRNKEALAAKFAHVKDDPNKKPVEL